MLIAVMMSLSLGAAPTTPTAKRVDKLLNAIEWQESKGRSRAVGDGGISRGAYQIQSDYWRDATRGKIPYRPNVWDKNKSRQVVVQYWKRYAPKALKSGDVETLARVHNGGPAGANPKHKSKYKNTTRYWNEVKNQIGKHDR